MGRGDTVLATLRNRAVGFELEDDSTSWTEVAILVRRAQAGDRAAFGRLVEQFQRTVHAIGLRRLGNASEAAELTQEVFLHVMRRIGQLREPERFAGWLRQVTVRMAINRATRRVAPSCVETVVLEGACAERDDPLAELIARERAQRLWEAMAELKALDREALLAFYIQGESLVEIAERLDVPIGTVKRRLHTARKRLRAELVDSVSDAGEWSEAARPVALEDENSGSDDLVGIGSGASVSW
jgi:RNA polymerase sigma-70 factor (ECF subfamily)